jgi:hypothetical protein
MSLVDLEPFVTPEVLPADVRCFLREADRRIERFQLTSRIPAFVASDFAGSYRVLKELARKWVTPGTLFCEWGSGFGVVACLAAMLDFDACGIEIEAELVDAAQQLADDFDLPVRFVQGSFIPRGCEACVAAADDLSWLTLEAGGTHEELGLTPDDFAVIFAYPWPDEERITADLFACHAGAGALLVTYHGGDSFRVRRRTGER